MELTQHSRGTRNVTCTGRGAKAATIGLAAMVVLASAVVTGCGPKYPNCGTDSTCQSHGEYCLNNKCAQCRETAHCANADSDACVTCEGGACGRKPGCCANNLDCASGKKCNENKCIAECQGDADCTGGKTCSADGACVSPDAAGSGCSTDGDCGAGLRCAGGTCVNASGECELIDVNFGYDEHTLSADAQSSIEANASCLKEKGATSVVVEGHCDERGTDAYNLELGNRRARSVRKYLKQIASKRMKIKTISYGKTRPTCESASESCWSRNRRGEFKIKAAKK